MAMLEESENETTVESRVRIPRAPGPPYWPSGSADLTTRDSQIDRSAGVAREGVGGPLGMLRSMKPLTWDVPEEEIGRLVSISVATLPTHSSRLTPVVLTAAGERPRPGGVPPAPRIPKGPWTPP